VIKLDYTLYLISMIASLVKCRLKVIHMQLTWFCFTQSIKKIWILTRSFTIAWTSKIIIVYAILRV